MLGMAFLIIACKGSLLTNSLFISFNRNTGRNYCAPLRIYSSSRRLDNAIINLPQCPICLTEYSPTNNCYCVCEQGHCVCESFKNYLGTRSRPKLCPVCQEPQLPGGGYVNREAMALLDILDTIKSEKVISDIQTNSSLLTTDNGTNELQTLPPSLDQNNSPQIPASAPRHFTPTAMTSDTAIKLHPSKSIHDKFIQYCKDGDNKSLQILLNQYDCNSIINKIYLKEKYSSDQLTPLIYASKQGHTDIVRVLLDNGANIECPDKCNYTALMEASQEGHIDVVKLLVERGAKVNAKVYGATSLKTASTYGHFNVVQYLIEKGAKVRNSEAIISASEYGYINIVKLLLEKGANVNMITLGFSSTALIEASSNGHTNVVKLLLENDANTNMQNYSGDTALIQACKYEHKETVQILLKNGADIRIKNKDGCTAMDFANDDIVKLFPDSYIDDV